MNYTNLSNFVNNVENIISNIIENKEFTTVKTGDGNVVIMPEQQFNYFIEALRRSSTIK